MTLQRTREGRLPVGAAVIHGGSLAGSQVEITQGVTGEMQVING